MASPSPDTSTPVPMPSNAREIPSKDRWHVKPLNDGKAKYPLPATWNSGALHHKISKERLSSIAEQLTPAWNSKTPALQKAARAFWSLCCQVAGPAVTAAVAEAGPGGAANPHRLLWNLPLMVSIGPESVANDPGMSFDADTVPHPDGSGARQMDAVSLALKGLEDAWLTASNAANGQGVYDAALWNTLHARLTAAHQAAQRTVRGDKVLFPPLEEQWVYDAKTKQNLRKGMTPFPARAQGTRLFAQARVNAPAIAAYAGSPTVAAASVSAVTPVGGRGVTLHLSATEETLHHVCVRHTLTFFDFTSKARPRPVNTFWPDVRTFADVTVLATALLPGIGASFLRALEHQEANVSAATDWLDHAVEIGNEDIGGQLVFYNVQITDVLGTEQAPALHAVVESFAPDGANGLGFTRGDLDEIGKAV